MKQLFVILILLAVISGLWATLAPASELAQTPSIAGLTPFTPETNNMSLAGYARWQHRVQTGIWLYYFTPETLYMSMPGYVRLRNYSETGTWLNIKTGQPM